MESWKVNECINLRNWNSKWKLIGAEDKKWMETKLKYWWGIAVISLISTKILKAKYIRRETNKRSIKKEVKAIFRLK